MKQFFLVSMNPDVWFKWNLNICVTFLEFQLSLFPAHVCAQIAWGSLAVLSTDIGEEQFCIKPKCRC